MSCNYFLVIQLELPCKTVSSCSSLLYSLCLISSPPFFLLSWCQWLTAIPPHLHRLPTPQSHTLLLHLIRTFNLTLLKLTTGLSHSTMPLVTSLYFRTNTPFQKFLGHSMACVKVWANALILTAIWLDVDGVQGVVSIMWTVRWDSTHHLPVTRLWKLKNGILLSCCWCSTERQDISCLAPSTMDTQILIPFLNRFHPSFVKTDPKELTRACLFKLTIATY